MAQYIDKDALVAEIQRWIELLTNEKNQEGISQIDKLSLGGRIAELQEVKSFIDTLEVKEVDLEKEIKEDWLFADKTEVDCLESMCLTEDMFVSLAKKYFELGLKVAQKGEEV